MCASEDAAMQSAVKMAYEYNEEEAIRDMCRARREAVAYEEYIKEEKERLLLEKEKLEAENTQLEAENSKLRAELELLRKMVKND